MKHIFLCTTAIAGFLLTVSCLPQAPPVPPVTKEVHEAVKEVHETIEKVEEKVEEKIEELKEDFRELTFEEVLDAQARLYEYYYSEKLNWRESVVDLMKMWRFNSSFKMRKHLAQEWSYRNYRGTAKDNKWLHAQILNWLRGNKP